MEETFSSNNESFGYKSPFNYSQDVRAIPKKLMEITLARPINCTRMFTSNNTPIFGRNANNTGFKQQSIPAFGQQQTPQFCSGLFGNTKQTTPNSNLFNSNAFGQQANKAFGFGSNSNTNLFGTPPNTSLFSSASSSMNPFGNTSLEGNMSPQNTTNIVGSPIKFTPTPATDNITKSGMVQTINIKHQVLTAMKEYQGKSFEEIRFEDYQLGRKGPSIQMSPLFPSNNTVHSSLLFPKTDQSKPMFPAQSLFGQSNLGLSQNTLNKPAATFGSTSSPFSFNSNNMSGNVFKSDPKPFGSSFAPQQTPTQSIFGSNQFGQNVQKTTSVFPKQNLPPFNSNSLPSTAFELQKPSSNFGFTFGPTSVTNTAPFQAFPQLNTMQAPQPSIFQQTNTYQQQMQNTLPINFPTTQQTNQPHINQFNQQQTPIQNQNPCQLSNVNVFQQANTLFKTPDSSPFQPPFYSTPQTNTNSLTTKTPEENHREMQNIITHFDYYGSNPALAGLQPIMASPGHYVTNPKDIETILSMTAPEKTNTSVKIKTYEPKKYRLHESFDHVYEKKDDCPPYERHSRKFLNLNPKKSSDLNQNSSVLVSKSIDEFFSKSSFNEKNKAKNNPQEEIITFKRAIKQNASENTNFMEESFYKKTYGNSSLFHESLPRVNLFEQEKSFQSVGTSTEDNSDCDSVYEDAIEDPSVFEKNLSSNQETAIEEIYISRKFTIGKNEFPPKTSSSLPDFALHFKRPEKYYSSITKILDELPNCHDTIENLCNQYCRKSLYDGNDKCSGDVESPSKCADVCGVTFTRPDYYMIPEYKKLQEYKTPDGKCSINGLTIGRLGFGNVHFLEEVDVTNINIDETIIIDKRTITVYPDHIEKPPKGEGLNVPAQITLDNVYPRIKQKEDVLNPSGEVLNNFVRTLRKVSERMGAQFQDYRPESGSWVFVVDHF